MNTDNKMRKNRNSPEYNKEYYEKNREAILAKACTKVACHFCGRMVMKNNLPYHKKTQLCARTQEQQLNEKARLEGKTRHERIIKERTLTDLRKLEKSIMTHLATTNTDGKEYMSKLIFYREKLEDELNDDDEEQ